jgi:hypothetical protein
LYREQWNGSVVLFNWNVLKKKTVPDNVIEIPIPMKRSKIFTNFLFLSASKTLPSHNGEEECDIWDKIDLCNGTECTKQA